MRLQLIGGQPGGRSSSLRHVAEPAESCSPAIPEEDMAPLIDAQHLVRTPTTPTTGCTWAEVYWRSPAEIQAQDARPNPHALS